MYGTIEIRKSQKQFFVPAARSAEEALKVYEATSQFAEEQLGRKTRLKRIERICFDHDGQTWEAVVGERFAEINELVIAIFEMDQLFIVCTPNRGVLRGEPYLVGKDSTRHYAEFSKAQDK